MKKFLFAGAMVAGLLCLAATPGSAQVARPDTALKTQMGDNIVQAQWRGGWRGGGWRGGGWGGGWRGGYYRGGGWALGGLAAGAIVGGALAAPYYYGGSPYYGSPYYDSGYAAPAPVYPGGDGVAYCMQRYRSYDAVSGTFLGNDGYRHPCP